MLKKLGLLLALLGLAFGLLLLSSGQARFASEAALELPASAAAVWARLMAVGEWPRWWPGVVAASLAPGWQPGAELQLGLQGDPEQAPAVVELVRPEGALAWRRPGILGSETRTALELQPANGATRVVLRSEILGPQAVLARWTAQDDFRRYQELVLQRLGESLRPERAHHE